MAIPVTPRMATIIDATPAGQMLILLAPRGQPWSRQHLSKTVKAHMRTAGIDERLRLNDFCGAACTRPLLAGGTLAEIALVMGWSVEKTAKMIRAYASLDPSATDGVLIKLAAAKSGTGL